MSVITVHTTQNIDIDYETGGLGERILARLIDFGVFIALAIVGGILAIYVPNEATAAFFIIVGLMFVFYDLFCEVFFNGQSVGKHTMKIRVISLDGARPKFSQYLLRWLFRMVDFAITPPGVVGLICAAVTTKGQRVGDVVAGTAIIKTVPRTKMDNIVFTTTQDDYVPVFPSAGELTDREINLIYEVMENYFRTGNNELVYTMADKIRQHLRVNLPPNMNSMQFLQVVMKDHSHIMAHVDVV